MVTADSHKTSLRRGCFCTLRSRCRPRCATSSTPRGVISLSVVPALLLSLFIATPASAVPITYTFDASADFVSGASGDFSGSFTFDQSTPPKASDTSITFTGIPRYNGEYGFDVMAENNKTILMMDFLPTHKRSLELTFVDPLSSSPDPLFAATLVGASQFEDASNVEPLGIDGEVVGGAVPFVTTPVPEASSAALLLTGVLGLTGCGVLRRSRCS